MELGLPVVSLDVVLCAVIVKSGLSLVGSIAGVALSLRVIPLVVQHQVLTVKTPEVFCLNND